MVTDLVKKHRYDVGLVNLHRDGSRTEIWWAIHVDMVRANEAAFEIMVMKEKEGSIYEGDIVIRPTQPIVSIYRPYNGSLCEADGDDNRSGGDRRLQSVGGDKPGYGECDHCGQYHHTADHESIQRKNEDAKSALKRREEFRLALVDQYPVQIDSDRIARENGHPRLAEEVWEAQDRRMVERSIDELTQDEPPNIDRMGL